MSTKKVNIFMPKEINYVKKFSTNLKLLVKHYNISLRKLGRIIGIASPHLTRLANGIHANPGLEILEKLAVFFNISIAQLIGEQKIDFKKLPKKIDLDRNNKDDCC